MKSKSNEGEYISEKDKVAINIPKKPKVENVEKVKVTSPKTVYNLKEVQAIKDAVQEHFLFIGTDNSNNLRNISFLGIGNSNGINIDCKYIVRTALVNACDKVIFVHNHPSNSLKPSVEDKRITNYMYKLLKLFNIKLVDHIIVTEENYVSMLEENYIDKYYKDNDLEMVDNMILIEENKELREKLSLLERKSSKCKEIER